MFHFHHICLYLLLAVLAEGNNTSTTAAPHGFEGSVNVQVLEFDDNKIKVFAELPSRGCSVRLRLIRYEQDLYYQEIDKAFFNNSQDSIVYTFVKGDRLSSFLFHQYNIELALLDCPHAPCKYNKTFVADPPADRNLTCSNWTAEVYFSLNYNSDSYDINFSLNPPFRNCPFEDFKVSLFNYTDQEEELVDPQVISNVTKVEVVTVTFPNVNPGYVLIWPSKPYCDYCAINVSDTRNYSWNGAESQSMDFLRDISVETSSYFSLIIYSLVACSCFTIGLLVWNFLKKRSRGREQQVEEGLCLQDQESRQLLAGPWREGPGPSNADRQLLISRSELQQSTLQSQETIQDRPSLWLVYPYGLESMNKAVQKLTLFLGEWLSFHVILDTKEEGEIFYNRSSWIDNSLRQASVIVLVESYESATQWRNLKEHKPVRPTGPPSSLRCLFQKCAEKLESSDKPIIVVNFWRPEDQPEFPSAVFNGYFRYNLEDPEHCKLLYLHLKSQKPPNDLNTCESYPGLKGAMVEFQKDPVNNIQNQGLPCRR